LATMTLSTAAVGREFPPFEYQVGREKIREYATAVGFEEAIHFDPDEAREAGFRDVVAPPMFCVVYSAGAIGPALFDPEVGMDFARMVHGAQAFEWGEPVCSGDLITTTATCISIEERDDKGFYVFESRSVNGDGAETVRGTWTNIVRGA
jgi:acyl dehydratase